MAIAPNTRLQNRYVVTTQVKSGGAMGEIYEAEDDRLGKRVFIKVLPLSIRDDEAARQRFERGAKLSARIDSPHIAQVIDIGNTEDGRPFVVMAYLPGETLEQRLARQPKLVPIEAARLIIQCLNGVGAAHEADIIHRDLKPGNIFLQTQPTGDFVKIIDFGLSRLMKAAYHATQDGSLVGTPYYMSPEQIAGDELDQRSDLFALGLVLYRCVAGKHPFDGGHLGTILYKIAHTDAPSLLSAAPRTEPRLSEIVGKALARSRDDRYRSTSEFREDLEAWVAQEEASLRGGPPSVIEPKAAAPPAAKGPRRANSGTLIGGNLPAEVREMVKEAIGSAPRASGAPRRRLPEAPPPRAPRVSTIPADDANRRRARRAMRQQTLHGTPRPRSTTITPGAGESQRPKLAPPPARPPQRSWPPVLDTPPRARVKSIPPPLPDEPRPLAAPPKEPAKKSAVDLYVEDSTAFDMSAFDDSPYVDTQEVGLDALPDAVKDWLDEEATRRPSEGPMPSLQPERRASLEPSDEPGLSESDLEEHEDSFEDEYGQPTMMDANPLDALAAMGPSPFGTPSSPGPTSASPTDSFDDEDDIPTLAMDASALQEAIQKLEAELPPSVGAPDLATQVAAAAAESDAEDSDEFTLASVDSVGDSEPPTLALSGAAIFDSEPPTTVSESLSALKGPPALPSITDEDSDDSVEAAPEVRKIKKDAPAKRPDKEDRSAPSPKKVAVQPNASAEAEGWPLWLIVLLAIALGLGLGVGGRSCNDRSQRPPITTGGAR